MNTCSRNEWSNSLLTVSGSDYSALSDFDLNFSPCIHEVCTHIDIIDDSLAEINETFSLSLGRSPDLDSRISLSPVSGTVVIVDNDGQKQRSFITKNSNICSL